jgi:hypothetical protein
VIAMFNRYEDQVYLYRPLKGEYIVIPSQSKDKSKDKCSLFMVGIGFEPTQELFKVVRCYRGADKDKAIFEINTYTFLF